MADSSQVEKELIAAFLAFHLMSLAENESTDESSDDTGGMSPSSDEDDEYELTATFDGDVTQWLSFWDEFKAVVHQNSGYCNKHKFQLLLEHLEGPAFQAVRHLVFKPGNYNKAISILKKEFGDPEKIAVGCIEALKKIPKLATMNCWDVIRFVENCLRYITPLEFILKKTRSNYEDKATLVLLTKLPNQTRENMIKKHGSKPWTIEEFMDSLHKASIWEKKPEKKEPECQPDGCKSSNSGFIPSPVNSKAKDKQVEIPKQTAIADVSYHSSACTANIVVGGCYRTVISKQLADKLQLPIIYKEEISLRTLHKDTVEKETYDVVCLDLNTNKGQLPVKALVLEEICKPLNIKGRSKLKDLDYLKDLKLAHPFSNDEEFPVDLLIGDNVKYEIVGTEVTKGKGPDAVESCLGYLLNWPTTPQEV